MGAVLEGCIEGIPSVGFSLLHHSMKADFTPLHGIRSRHCGQDPREWLCPRESVSTSTFRPASCRRAYACAAPPRDVGPTTTSVTSTHSACPFYRLTGKFINEEPEATDTDEYWLQRRYISSCPSRATSAHAATSRHLPIPTTRRSRGPHLPFYGIRRFFYSRVPKFFLCRI